MKAYELFLKSSGITIDSRHIGKDQLFLALKGPNFNGNSYVEEALNKGAIGAIVDEKRAVLGERCILVDSVLQCLQEMATLHRSKMNIPVIGLTGSNGKTTVKELLQRSLASKFSVLATQGNFNNHIGVPLTLLRITTKHDMAIIEMGANHQGEIKSYCQWAQPTHGIITNIGRAHLEGFGGIEGVFKGKMELFDFVCSSEGHVFYPYDEQRIDAPLSNYTHKTTFGLDTVANFSMPIRTQNDVLTLWQKNQMLDFQLKGAFNRNNIVGAACIADHFGIMAENYLPPLLSYNPSNNRSQYLQKNQATVVLDAYNANPSSMRASIEGFMARSGDKILILGEMKELGTFSKDEHQRLVNFVQSLPVSLALFYGQEFSTCELDVTQQLVKDKNELHRIFADKTQKECSILIKGSRSCRLEQLLD